MSKNKNTAAEAEAEFETFNVSNKLTVASMGLTPGILKGVAGDKPTPVATILANVVDMKEKPSTLDSSRTDVRFIGQFEGTNLLTGEVVRSGSAYLPGAAQEFLQGLAANGEVAIAIQLTVQKDARANSAQGYRFGVTTIGEKSSFDPFAQLRSKVPALGKAAK